MSLVKTRRSTRGWLVGGLHPSDPGGYRQVKWVGYGSGYATVPAMVNLRAGETLRRYHKPGLADGKTFAHWGITYGKKIPGPERGRTWVNQPDKLFNAKRGVYLQAQLQEPRLQGGRRR